MKFKQYCSSKPPAPYSHSHRSPAHTPSAPCTPLHLRILVHLSGLEILVRNVICGAELLVSLVLLRSTDIGLVMSRVGENVVGSPLSGDHGHFARRKLLQLLLLRSGLGGDHLKAGRHQHAFFILGAACCGAADRYRQQGDDADHVERGSYLFHFCSLLMILICRFRRSLATAQTNRFALRLARDSAPSGTLSRLPAFTQMGLWSYYFWRAHLSGAEETARCRLSGSSAIQMRGSTSNCQSG